MPRLRAPVLRSSSRSLARALCSLPQVWKFRPEAHLSGACGTGNSAHSQALARISSLSLRTLPAAVLQRTTLSKDPPFSAQFLRSRAQFVAGHLPRPALLLSDSGPTSYSNLRQIAARHPALASPKRDDTSAESYSVTTQTVICSENLASNSDRAPPKNRICCVTDNSHHCHSLFK